MDPSLVNGVAVPVSSAGYEAARGRWRSARAGGWVDAALWERGPCEWHVRTTDADGHQQRMRERAAVVPEEREDDRAQWHHTARREVEATGDDRDRLTDRDDPDHRDVGEDD